MSRQLRGAAAVEFALCFPPFMVCILVILEITFYVSHFHQLQRAARDGARMGASIVDAPDPTEDIPQAAVEHAHAVLAASGLSCDADCQVEAAWITLDGWRFVEVEVSNRYPSITNALPILAPDSTASFRMLTHQQ